LVMPRPPGSRLVPYTTLFRSPHGVRGVDELQGEDLEGHVAAQLRLVSVIDEGHAAAAQQLAHHVLATEVAPQGALQLIGDDLRGDRKSTRLNSSHGSISYAVF